MRTAACAVVLVVGGSASACGQSADDRADASLSPSSSASATTASPTTSPAPPPIDITLPPTDAPVAERALRDELRQMLVLDQAVRTGTAPPGDDRTADELAAAWDETDRVHGVRMAEILDQYGWPGWKLVGADGAFAAWVLIQHADLDLPLQKRGLDLMQAAVAANDADPSDLAYLVDRVRVAEGQPQVYGTQWGSDAAGNAEPRTPIEDPENVDIRRAAVGLGTIADYLEEFTAFVDDEG